MSVGFATAQAAGVYKWVDEKGAVHFGDAPPGNAAASEVEVAPPPPVDASLLQRQEQGRKMLQAGQEERAAAEKQQAEANVKAEQNAKDCANLKLRLKQYTEARYLYKAGDTGQEAILSDAERAQAVSETQAAIDELCN
jgi:hypothetical protein